MKPIPKIILAPLIAHPLWAVFMLASPVPIHTMGIDATYHVTPGPWSATVVMFVASVMAWLSHRDGWHGRLAGFALIVPQQFLMLLSLWTICTSVWYATYPNTYAPPEGWHFIAADQVFFATACVLHSIRVWDTYGTRKNLPCERSSICPDFK